MPSLVRALLAVGVLLAGAPATAEQPAVRGRTGSVEMQRGEPVPSSTIPRARADQTLEQLAPAGSSLPAKLDLLHHQLLDLEAAVQSNPTATPHRVAARPKATLRELQGIVAQLQGGVRNARALTGQDILQSDVNQLGTLIDGMLRDLEAQDKMANFDVQGLLSRCTQAQQLSSSVQKKADQTAEDIIQKIN